MANDERAFIYVRHSQVEVREGDPSRAWGLSDAGRESARSLGERLRRAGITSARIACSSEEKAIATARELAPYLLAEEILPLAGLDEATRPWVDGDYASVAEEYLQGRQVPGWEPMTSVVERVDGGIRSAIDGEVRVIVGHGLSFSAWLSAVAPKVSPAGFWRSLAFPDARSVNLASGEVAPLGED